jgi:hypothetical protein
MTWNIWIRQIHRWLSIAFTAGVATNTVVIFGLKQAHPAPWIYLLAGIPLFLLLATGLYLFALPYVTAWSRAVRGGGRALADGRGRP